MQEEVAVYVTCNHDIRLLEEITTDGDHCLISMLSRKFAELSDVFRIKQLQRGQSKLSI